MKLTRYLYEKDYVEHSLFMSLLNRNSDEALFWIYELYFSGWKKYSIILIWKYYYMLYSPFFVNLEPFLQRKTLEWLDTNDYRIIGTLIVNLATREACVDFYMMMINIIPYPAFIRPWVNRLDLNISKSLNVLEDFIYINDCFKNKGEGCYEILLRTFDNIEFLNNTILKFACISRMFSGMFLLDENNGLDKKLFISLLEKDCKKYKTRPIIDMKSWKIPENECIYKIQVPPNKPLLNIDIYQNWLYYCYNTPIWKKRIERYLGYLHNDVIHFDCEDDEERFYNMYDLEPDEQKLQVLQNWFGEQKYNSWNEIYKKYSLEILHTWLNTNLERIIKK